MKKSIIILATGILFALSANAQLGKQMSKYHDQNGITVTQLDKSLYGLYQQGRLSPETSEMLQKLDEVNILNIDLNVCQPELSEKIMNQFQNILDNDEKYKLVKSKNDGTNRQFIYSRQKDGTITNLAVWNQTPNQLDIIELIGNIQLDRIALLSRALNIQGLHSLNALAPNAPAGTHPFSGHFFANSTTGSAKERISQMRQGMYQNFSDIVNQFFSSEESQDSSASSNFPFDKFNQFFSSRESSDSNALHNSPFERIEEMLNRFDGFGMADLSMFTKIGAMGDVSSSSVQITNENGKTKFKIDSQNSDIIYVIDGQITDKDSLQMPEKIRNVNLIPSREDIKKSYLFISSEDKLGEFISYSNGTLTFRHNQQEYRYNLDKAEKPILVIDGRLSSAFNIEPSRILQIRPISQIEKENGYYPHAEVMINTR